MTATPGAPGGRADSAPLLGRAEEPTIFELSSPGRRAWSFAATDLPGWAASELVPPEHLAPVGVPLAEVSERDLVAHHTRLTHRQYSVDLGAYPLGSCTMKYNPKLADAAAALPGLARVHPAAPASCCQGWLQLLVHLGEALVEVTGMHAITLTPPAGAAGELTGLLVMRAHHGAAGGGARTKVIIPDSAHGTNPASVTLGGYEAVTVASDERGLVDVAALRAVLSDDVAGIMLTNPNTLGLFEEDIVEIAAAVHEVGGLVYYDGANLNAILGVTRPGDMGFDIVHLNLHKTFAVPHGGGGPGAGPVAVTEALAPYLPGPLPAAAADGTYGWAWPERSIGRVHGWYGNALALARAHTYVLALGGDGLRRVAEAAVLNANWLRRRLAGHYRVPYDRPCMHECVVSAADLRRTTGVRAQDVAKRLLEEGFHAPTVSFPLVVEEALMIEPTETESPQTLAALADALVRIAEQASSDDRLAPRTTPVGRVDEARAARRLITTFDARPSGPVDEQAPALSMSCRVGQNSPMTTLVVLDQGASISISFDDLLKYHGRSSIAGVAHAFKAMERAFPLLSPGEPPERSDITVESGFPGGGARDGFEMVTRAVTGDRYRLASEPGGIEAPEAPGGHFFFRLGYRGTTVELVARAGLVSEEFLHLACKEGPTPAEAVRSQRLKEELAERLLSLPADEVYDANFL